MKSYLIGAILVVGAVILVYNNRVCDIYHYYVLEKNIPNEAVARPCPCLHSHAVFGSGERGGLHRHVLDSGFVLIPP